MTAEIPDELQPQQPDYRTEVSIESARADIERLFPEVSVADMQYLNSGQANTAFETSNGTVFRFAKHERASAGLIREESVLRAARGKITTPIPDPRYSGDQNKTKFHFLGHKKLEGVVLTAEVVKTDPALRASVARELAVFMQQVQAINPDETVATGPIENKYASEKKRLESAQSYLYPLLDELYPAEAAQIKEYLQGLIARAEDFEKGTSYTPTLIHGDLEAEHILYDPASGKLTGIIDWGGTEITDPDYELWRLYANYGPEFIDELFKSYPHPDKEKLLEKCDFFFRSQMVRRVVRPLEISDTERAGKALERLRMQALGAGYWYDELPTE